MTTLIMKFSGNRNLLTSSYVFGTRFPENSPLDFIKNIESWCEFKQTDGEMRHYLMRPTHSVTMLHYVPVNRLSTVLQDLIRIYKKAYPDGERTDFISHVLNETIYDLTTILERLEAHTIYYGDASPAAPSNVYYYLDQKEGKYYEYLLEFHKNIDDSPLESHRDIHSYIQYYKRVLNLFKEFDFYPEVKTTENEISEIEQVDVNSIKVLPQEPLKYKTIHHAAAYIFEIHSKGESLPIGKKQKLETIGNLRIGQGKGNTFYKQFNELMKMDMSSKQQLDNKLGDTWRDTVLHLCQEPTEVKRFLESKGF